MPRRMMSMDLSSDEEDEPTPQFAADTSSSSSFPRRPTGARGGVSGDGAAAAAATLSEAEAWLRAQTTAPDSDSRQTKGGRAAGRGVPTAAKPASAADERRQRRREWLDSIRSKLTKLTYVLLTISALLMIALFVMHFLEQRGMRANPNESFVVVADVRRMAWPLDGPTKLAFNNSPVVLEHAPFLSAKRLWHSPKRLWGDADGTRTLPGRRSPERLSFAVNSSKPLGVLVPHTAEQPGEAVAVRWSDVVDALEHNSCEWIEHSCPADGDCATQLPEQTCTSLLINDVPIDSSHELYGELKDMIEDGCIAEPPAVVRPGAEDSLVTDDKSATIEVSVAGTGRHTAVEMQHTTMVQLAGTQRVVLLPNSEWIRLMAFPALHPRGGQASVDPLAPLPEVVASTPRALQHQLEAGEVLYTPPGWFRFTHAENETSVALVLRARGSNEYLFERACEVPLPFLEHDWILTRSQRAFVLRLFLRHTINRCSGVRGGETYSRALQRRYQLLAEADELGDMPTDACKTDKFIPEDLRSALETAGQRLADIFLEISRLRGREMLIAAYVDQLVARELGPHNAVLFVQNCMF